MAGPPAAASDSAAAALEERGSGSSTPTARHTASAVALLSPVTTITCTKWAQKGVQPQIPFNGQKQHDEP